MLLLTEIPERSSESIYPDRFFMKTGENNSFHCFTFAELKGGNPCNFCEGIVEGGF